MPAGYDREYVTKLSRAARLRVGMSTTRGRVDRFVVQLEYRHRDAWAVVVRFDHDSTSEMGHDVTEDGLHLDVYRDGEKYRVERGFRSVDINDAIDYCEMYIRDNAERFIRRFEQWHNVNESKAR